MPRGWCPLYFYNNPRLDKNKRLPEIWEDIQNYSGEFFYEDKKFFRVQTDFIVPLPPLLYGGKFLKGMFMSEGVDYIHSIFPRINELFFSMAYTMWSSLPYSKKAEVYLSCYDYPERIDWFKKRYPEKADKIYIPLQDADFTNEYVIAPTFATPKEIDVLSIGRMTDVKNLDILLKALMAYHRKYGIILNAVLIVGKKVSDFDDAEKLLHSRLEKLAGGSEEFKKYLKLVDRVNYGEDLNRYYTKSRLLVLTSIYEGKNRSINEANCCNTPVIVFKDLSKYTRGNDKAFPDNAGLYVPEFTPESLCDTIHEAFRKLNYFTPRKSYLVEKGRKAFLNLCIDSIPYYRENLPDYVPGKAHENVWLDLAMQANYQLSLIDFLYGKNTAIHHTKLHEYDTKIMDFFNSRFMISGGEKILPDRGGVDA